MFGSLPILPFSLSIGEDIHQVDRLQAGWGFAHKEGGRVQVGFLFCKMPDSEGKKWRVDYFKWLHGYFAVEFQPNKQNH